MANRLYQDIMANPEKIQELTDNRASENIFYTVHEKKGLSELPSIYENNRDNINLLATHELSPIFEGFYGNSAYRDENGEVAYEELNGFTFLRILEKETGNRTSISIQDIVEVATQLGLPYNQTLDIQSSDQGIARGTYQVRNKTLKYNNGELYNNQEAYKARILAYLPESTLGLIEEEAMIQEQEMADRIKTIKSELENDPRAELEDTLEISRDRVGLAELKQAIPSFSNQATDPVQIYEEEGITYIVTILEKKSPNEKKF